jgi:hypothetical protein
MSLWGMAQILLVPVCYPFSTAMLIKTIALSAFFCWSFFAFSPVWAQKGKTESQIAQDFTRYLASRNGQHNRVDKKVLPWSLSDVYLNDSLWAQVTISDESRIAARRGMYGGGPLLRMDYKLTDQDFERLKAQIRKPGKTAWTSADFPDSTVVVQEMNLAPIAHYAYSKPLVLASRNLILVKRRFHSELIDTRWTCVEVYRVLKSGQFKRENCYLRTNP